ncbi:hypothetical protein BDW62DRAFT_167011 [Aspergillus aurantiobrunneus]
MCRHIYHHYATCGHIASFTLDACIELTNAIRSQVQLANHSTLATHDLLFPVQKIDCMQCKVEQQTGMQSSRHPGSTSQFTNRVGAQNPLNYIALEGINASGPLITADFTMTVPPSPDARQGQVLYSVAAGTVVRRDSNGFGGEPSSDIPPEAMNSVGEEWADTEIEYEMCNWGEPRSQFRTSFSLSPSDYETVSEGFPSWPASPAGSLSPKEPEYWTPGRTRLQSPTPGFDGDVEIASVHGQGGRLGLGDVDFDEFACYRGMGRESVHEGGFLQGLQVLFPAVFESNQDVFWEHL